MEENRCSVCGSILAAGDTLCPNCGSPVEVAEPVPTVDTEPVAPEVTEPVASEVAEPVSPVGTEPVAPEVAEPAAPVAAEPVVPEGTKSAVSLEKPATEAVSEETTVLSGNPGYQASGTYNSSSATYNATYQDMPMDSTNYQGGYPQNTGVYTQTVEEPKKNSGKGLGIAAMIIGIISILCCVGGSLFGIIGIILAIVCIAKKTGKPFSIIGLVTSIVGFFLGLSVLISLISGVGLFATTANAVSDELEWDIYDSDNDIYDSDNDISSISYAIDINQMVINGDTYTVPGTLSSMGLTVDESDGDVVESITTDGLRPQDYEFVLLNSENGYSVWGYLENTGYDTVYSLDELQVTGLNVDNWSSACDGCSVTAYGGVTLGMSRSEVEGLIGEAYSVDGQTDTYVNESDDTYFSVEYDEDDYVMELDITYYTD